ncbi:relaxase/mobilization nuclease domain-containing protein [Pimelobacter sp. 30-1]|uniref:relaxase/mobilization nuclease domain-containing protein n=1 Tax=Pimelobacter sp. 30-1 TaxID=2004991 RepID=UPI001C04DD79|nr:relaxase/mobilization nuclease domain-containing protein [Pimelobacter sp. 30-1]MBU2698806.1 hypothetical protein [Pimelobacter sp. 30-1]
MVVEVIPNVVKGGNMYGLIRYLQGPGKVNEHENPHVVAGDDFLTAWYGTETLGAASVKEITDYLEAPRLHFGTKVQAQVTEQDPETGEKRVTGYRDAHVWHCSLSLAAEDGPLSNEQWQKIAGDFMDRMGFTEASGKAPSRWVAIHHGKSENGNDHIHIAASMVREDGTRWEGRYRDFQSAQDACREIERTHSLRTVGAEGLELHERGEKAAERGQADRVGLPTTAPKELGHRIRAAAVASSSEAEWIRRVRADGVVVKPFFAKGSTDVVSGYRAALKPGEYGEKLAFYGGGTLGRDLTLPRLRENWPAATVDQASEAAGEWQAAFRGRPPVGSGVESRRVSAKAGDVAARNFEAFNERLVVVPYTDRAAWADAARDVSGALSAWARYDKKNAADLRAASSTLARSAQYERKAMPPGRRVKESPMGTAFLFLAAKPEDQGKIAGALLLRQLMTTAKALAAHHRALGDLRHAQALERDVVARLERVQLAGYAHAGASPSAAAQTARDVGKVADPHQASGREAPSRTPEERTRAPQQPGEVLPRPLSPPRRGGLAPNEPIAPTRDPQGGDHER